MFKKFIATILVGVLTVSITSSVYASDDLSVSREERIKQIYEERASILLEGDTIYSQKYEDLGKELKSLGVEFLTAQEVQKKNNTLSLSAGIVRPMVTIPESNNVIWSSYRNNFVKNGVTYEVQHLAAEASNKSSNLWNEGNMIKHTSRSWQAGLLSLAKSVASEGASKIPGVDITLTLYDAISGAINDVNFSKTTEVSDVEASYLWKGFVNVDFMFVKKTGTSDNTQELSYVTTAVTGVYSWNIPAVTYKSNGAAKTVKIIQGNRSFSNTPTAHRNGSLAVNAYVNGIGMQPKGTYVTRIDLTGLEGSSVKTIYPLTPIFIGQVY